MRSSVADPGSMPPLIDLTVAPTYPATGKGTWPKTARISVDPSYMDCGKLTYKRKLP
jgi:hypothetical protein